MTATGPELQATAFSDLLADRIAASTGRRPAADPTPGGPLRMLDAALGGTRVDEALAAAMYGSTADQLHRRGTDRTVAFTSRTAARTTAWMDLRRPLLTAWRPIEHWETAEAARTVLATSRQLPGPFAAAADALLFPTPAELDAVAVRVDKLDVVLVRGPLERLVAGHLHTMFDTVWEALKDRAVGGRSDRLAKGVLADFAGRISPTFMEAKHAAERDGDHAEAVRYAALLDALASPARPSSPANPAVWYSTSLSGRLGNWAALGCIAAELEPQWAGWVADLAPLPPMLLPPDHTLGSTVRSDLRPTADWWRARRDATRMPSLFLDDEFADDPHQTRTATLTRYRAETDDNGRKRTVVEETQHRVDLAAALTDPAHRTLLVAPPGAGKSDSIRVAAHNAADLRLRQRTATRGRIVVAAEAAAVATAHGTTLLAAAIAAIDPTTPPEIAGQLIAATDQDPQPLVLIDGYDEIADPAGRARLLDLVHNAAHPVVITTRPEHRGALLDRLLAATVLTPDPLDSDAVTRLVTSWLSHMPDVGGLAAQLLVDRPQIAALCTTPLYARLLATALAGGTDPTRLTTAADLLHAVLAVRVTDPARHRRPLPLTVEEIEDRIDAAATVGLAHLEARSVMIGTISPPRERVRRRDLRPLLTGSPVPTAVIEDVLGGLGIVDLTDDGTVGWPHQRLGEYLAGRALADMACSSDPDANRRYISTVLQRRAFQPDWFHPLALCAGELDRRARIGDPRAPAALARHRTLLTEPVLSVHSTAHEIRGAAGMTGPSARAGDLFNLDWDVLTEDVDIRTVARGELLRLAAAAALELAETSPTDQVLIEAGKAKGRGSVVGLGDDSVDLIRTSPAVDAAAEWLGTQITRCEIREVGHGWTISPVDGAMFDEIWAEVMAASAGKPHAALVRAFANSVPRAMALRQEAEIQECIEDASANCSCWPRVTAVFDPTLPADRNTVDPTAHDEFAQTLLDELETGDRRPRQRTLHGLLSLMARGSLRAAGGLLGCPPEDAADLATELLDAVPAELHVSPDLGPHPRKVDDLLPPAFGPPLDVGDLPFPLPPFTGATQFRAATLLLSGRVPETWDHTSTGDLYRMALTSRETGLPTDHFERWIAQTLSGPPALNSDGTPDWQADHNRYSELMNVAYSRVGDRLASKVDDPWVQHRIMCPAAPHRGWQKAPHGEAPDQSGVCDAVGHDTDDRWLGWHDRPTRATLLRGLKAARRAAEYHSGDWHGYAHHLGAVLAQAAPDLSGYLSIATDPTITSALVEVLHAAGLDAPPVGDPAAVWHAALEHTERTGTWGWDEAQDVNDLLAGLLLRSARWSEPLHLDVGHVALITDTQDFAQR